MIATESGSDTNSDYSDDTIPYVNINIPLNASLEKQTGVIHDRKFLGPEVSNQVTTNLCFNNFDKIIHAEPPDIPDFNSHEINYFLEDKEEKKGKSDKAE